jgi:dTDP-glucose 4,6-dehydratase
MSFPQQHQPIVFDFTKPPRRILVAGGAGFIGSHLCEQLVGHGAKVICVDNLSTGTLRNLEGLDAVEFVQADITHPWRWTDKVDVIYHLASPASPFDYARMPLETLAAGAAGTAKLLELAVRNRARFVLASTSEVYGDPLEHPQVESYWGNVNPIGERSCYDEAKRYAEALTVAYRRRQGANTAIARIFNTYGPRMRAHDGRAIPTFIRQALAGEPLTVFGDGSQTRSFCYVDDLVDGLIRLADAGEVHDPVNLGNPCEFTLKELADIVLDHLSYRLDIANGPTGIRFEPLPADDPKQRRPDISRAQDLLGWYPGVQLAEGLQKTIGSQLLAV